MPFILWKARVGSRRAGAEGSLVALRRGSVLLQRGLRECDDKLASPRFECERLRGDQNDLVDPCSSSVPRADICPCMILGIRCFRSLDCAFFQAWCIPRDVVNISGATLHPICKPDWKRRSTCGDAALALVALLAVPARIFAIDDQPLKPVTFTVVDAVTKKPVTEFSYTLRVTVPGEIDQKHDDDDGKSEKVKSPSGTFVVRVPVSCKLIVDFESPDIVAGYRHNEPTVFTILSADREPRFTVTLELGHTVAGVVRDAETKRPIRVRKSHP